MIGPRTIDLATLSAVVAEPSAPDRPSSPDDLVAVVASARLVCFPTDTVYGVGGLCRPRIYQAIRAVKGRQPGKPLQVIFPMLELLLAVVRPGPELAAALARLLPGPVTLVLPYPEALGAAPVGAAAEGSAQGRPPAGRAADGTPTLGVRVPLWPPAAGAMARLPWPLVASSANLSGAPPVRRLDDVAPAVRAACDLLLDGGEAGGVASTVVDLVGYAVAGRWRVLREGALGRAELTDVLGPPAAG